MTTIGSIGIGLFILIIVWILALILFVIAVRTQSSLGWFTIAAATAFTIILTTIPTEKYKTAEDTSIEKDYNYIYRTLLLSFLIFSVIVGFVSFFILHCIEPIRIKPIQSFIN